MSFINFITEQLKENVETQVKGLEYIRKVFNNLPKVIIKTGSSIFNTLLNV